METNEKRNEATWLPISMSQKLQTAAKDRHTSKSTYMRQAVAEKLESDGYV